VFGGVENWLLNVVRLRRDDLRMDLAVTGEIDPRVRAKFERLGVRVFACPSTYEPLRTAINLRRILRQQGPYDLLHCHMHRGNAHVAVIGRMTRVPAIVVHSHLDTSTQDARDGWGTNAKVWLAAALQRISSDMGLACSQAAGDCLFDRRWRERRNWSVLYYGIDFASFERPVDRSQARRRFGLPANAFVIGHVGRCEPVKNQAFILDLAARYTASNPEAFFVLAGDGASLPDLKRRARQNGLLERVRLLGAREDVPDLLLGLFDAFLLPSLAEGFAIAFLEAQAAGLPSVISDRIPPDARVLPGVEVLRIDQPIEDWCAALDRARGNRVSPQDAVAALRKAGYGVEESVRRLESQYRSVLRGTPVFCRLDRTI
jgi:glycosyltransferase involved in cell wall biosynthesis